MTKTIGEFLVLIMFFQMPAISLAHDVKKIQLNVSDIVIRQKSSNNNVEKGDNIIVSLNGHVLSVVFSESLGEVSVEIATASGITVNCLSLPTPNGMNIYVPLAGDYVVTFTLSNGDEYYGEFTIV